MVTIARLGDFLENMRAANAREVEPLSVTFAPPVPACERCGCTEARACPGGCFWIGPALCSACGRPAKHFEPLRASRVEPTLERDPERLR